MTSRERFDLWAESEAGFAVARYREVAFTGWQARDPEVRELVEALRELLRTSPVSSRDNWLDSVDVAWRVIAKHESGVE